MRRGKAQAHIAHLGKIWRLGTGHRHAALALAEELGHVVVLATGSPDWTRWRPRQLRPAAWYRSDEGKAFLDRASMAATSFRTYDEFETWHGAASVTLQLLWRCRRGCLTRHARPLSLRRHAAQAANRRSALRGGARRPFVHFTTRCSLPPSGASTGLGSSACRCVAETRSQRPADLEEPGVSCADPPAASSHRQAPGPPPAPRRQRAPARSLRPSSK